MALNSDKSGFGIDLGDRFGKKSVNTGRHTDAHADTDTHAHTNTDTDTHTDVKEKKTKRTYGLIEPSVYDKITAYAESNNTTYNAIVCELLYKLIEEKGL